MEGQASLQRAFAFVVQDWQVFTDYAGSSIASNLAPLASVGPRCMGDEVQIQWNPRGLIWRDDVDGVLVGGEKLGREGQSG